MQYPPDGRGDDLDFTPITDPTQRAELDAFIAECEEDDARDEAREQEEARLRCEWDNERAGDARTAWMRVQIARQDRRA